MIVTNSLTGGGAERSMNLVSNELTARGWPIALVPINSGESDLVIPKCEIFHLQREWQGGTLGTLSAIVKFNQLVRSWKPDVIVLNCELPELFGAFLIAKRRLVVIEHSNLAWTKRVRLGKVVRGVLRRRKTVWVAVSSHLQIWPDGTSPQTVLQNPLTPSIEQPEVLAENLPLSRLVFIGRLSAEKQPEQFLEIAIQLGLEAVIMGDGNMRSLLAAQAEASPSRVSFLGQVRDPWSQVRPGDLLIVPSRSEGDGLVVIEGMLRGIPMLLSDIADFRRFDLPDRNYCLSIKEFILRIEKSRRDLSSLVVPTQIANRILGPRSLQAVGDSWEKFLEAHSVVNPN